jgi:hypothetical protein
MDCDHGIEAVSVTEMLIERGLPLPVDTRQPTNYVELARTELDRADIIMTRDRGGHLDERVIEAGHHTDRAAVHATLALEQAVRAVRDILAERLRG